jgi:hypothetical protein
MQISKISLKRVKDKGPTGTLMIRVAMAVNDILAADHLRVFAKELDNKHAELQAGLIRYSIRMQIAHLREAIWLVEEVDKDPYLTQYKKKLSAEAQAAHSVIRELNLNGLDQSKFKTIYKRSRDSLTFHYKRAAADSIVKNAIENLVSKHSNPLGSVIAGEQDEAWFELADKVVNAAMCWDIWEVDHNLSNQQQRVAIDKELDWCFERSQAFLKFAFELSYFFFRDCSAI